MIGRPNGNYVPNHCHRRDCIPGRREERKKPLTYTASQPVTEDRLTERRRTKGYYQNHPEYLPKL